MRTARRGAAGLVVGVGLLLLPNSQVAPTVFSLVEVEESTAVDFGDGVVVVLALGSDSRSPDPLEGNADAIELIAINFETGEAAAVGIPRDTWTDVEGVGTAKINAGLPVGGPQLMASEVAELTGIRAQYVVTTGFSGFEELVDTVGQLSVQSEFEVEDPEYDLDVKPGTNELNGRQATGFARSRELPGNDFDRMANQQQLLEAILDKLRSQEDTDGFIESGALAALQHLDTKLSPSELYRFGQAISQIDPARTTTCVLTGPSLQIGANIGIDLDEDHARRVAADAVKDGHLEGDC
jgi:polyisoprenyl-teichoic acid--peptidoglycan teichoic acid transferase